MRRGNMIRERKTRQAGISLTEAILGIATLGVGLGVIAQIQTDNLENIRQQATAQQMKTLLGAAKGFVRDYYGPLVEGCTVPNCPTGSRTKDGSSLSMPTDIFSATGLGVGDTIEITADALFVAGYIDAGQFEQRIHPVTGVNEWLFKRNAYGADVLLTLTNTGPTPGAVVAADRLRLQLVTRGGVKLSDKKGAAVASKIGPDGGFRPADETLTSEANLGSSVYQSDNVYGAFGNWTITTADMGGVDFQPDTGGLAAVAYFGEGGVVADFLYRNAVPGQPEAQQMNANINANGFGIGNVTQIGATAAGNPANPLANPDMNDTNVAPDPVTATFGAATPLNVAGATADNTVRFGDVLPSGLGGLGATAARYDRGNVNIQANDMIGRNIDAADAVRGLQRVEAADRENDAANRRQRFGMYSGINPTGAAVNDPSLRGIDNNNRDRVESTFSREVTGAATIGTGANILRDGLNQQRASNRYNGVVGDLTLTDDTNRNRVRAGYTAADAGDITLRDGVGAAPGTQRFTTAYAATQGNTTLSDETGAVRVDSRYTAANDGEYTIRQQDGVERYRNQYTALDGVVRLRDNGGVGRQQMSYDANIGLISQNDSAGTQRSSTGYNGVTGQDSLTDNNNVVRSRIDYDATSTSSLLADATGAVRVSSDTGGAGFESTLQLSQPSGASKIEFASGLDNTTGTIRMRQPNNVEKVRIQSGSNADASQVEMFDETGQRRISLGSGTVAGAAQTFLRLDSAAGTPLAIMTGVDGANAGLELGDFVTTTDRIRLERAGAGDITDVNVVIGDNSGTGVINTDGAADAFRVTADGAANSRLRVESDGAIGINTDGPDARLDINCNAGDPNCVLWRNNGTATMNHLSNANGGAGFTRLGSYQGASASPMGAGQSVLDVDDIFLRSRGIWLSDATRYRVVDISILRDGETAGGAVPAGCSNTVAVAAPNSWASPVPRSRIRADGTDIGGTAYTAVRTYTTHLGGTSWRVNIEGRGRSFDEGDNALGDSGWRSINDARATVTVYCYN